MFVRVLGLLAFVMASQIRSVDFRIACSLRPKISKNPRRIDTRLNDNNSIRRHWSREADIVVIGGTARFCPMYDIVAYVVS